MKKILFIISLLFVTGCFQDKAEKAIMNCADTSFSRETVKNFNKLSNISRLFSIYYEPSDTIFDRRVVQLKNAGFKQIEVRAWYEELKKGQKEFSDADKEVINFLTNEKNKANNYQDSILKLPLTDRLQDGDYHVAFMMCEISRKEATKTFDAKWKKSILVRAKFRD